MNATIMLGPKEEQLLALLAEGGSTRALARKMHHSEGTVRVYLHRLYRAIGVRNRTEAVLWHLNRGRAATRRPDSRARSGVISAGFGRSRDLRPQESTRNRPPSS